MRFFIRAATQQGTLIGQQTQFWWAANKTIMDKWNIESLRTFNLGFVVVDFSKQSLLPQSVYTFRLFDCKLSIVLIKPIIFYDVLFFLYSYRMKWNECNSNPLISLPPDVPQQLENLSDMIQRCLSVGQFNKHLILKPTTVPLWENSKCTFLLQHGSPKVYRPERRAGRAEM